MEAKFIYAGVRVKNLPKSLDFYTKVLGMKIKRGPTKIKETKGQFVWLESPGGACILELNYYEKDSPYNMRYTVGEGLDHLAFKVEDLARAVKDAKSAGCPSILEVKTQRSRWVYIKDPNGIWVELF